MISCLFMALTSCEIDNYEAPNAGISGQFLDAKTNEPVPQTVGRADFQVLELGWENGQWQGWNVKPEGTYTNDMVFAATYNFRYQNGNCYPWQEDNIEIKKGNKNVRDFVVTPYIRIIDSHITKNGSLITATFKIEGGKSEVKVKELRLFAFSDQFVGERTCYAAQGTDVISLGTPEEIDSSKQYTLTIDTSKASGSDTYYSGKNYFFRIGALADVPNVGTIRYNYCKTVEIAF